MATLPYFAGRYPGRSRAALGAGALQDRRELGTRLAKLPLQRLDLAVMRLRGRVGLALSVQLPM
ncbi:hypothetical protein CS8_010060 [Cupriavidus sp. 8B]